MSFIILLVAHYIADFLLQSREMATKKSTDSDYLMEHVFIYGCAMWVASCFFTAGPPAMFQFVLINMIAHGFIDWGIWRLYKKHAPADGKYWEDYWFWATLGLDQTLHLSTLALTWAKILCS